LQAKQSVQAQAKLEARPQAPFEDFVAAYFA